MRRLELSARVARLRAGGQILLADHLRGAWWQVEAAWESVDGWRESTATAYTDRWQQGGRSRALALLLAPLMGLVLVALVVLALVARVFGVLAAGAVLAGLAAVAAAPLLGTVWVLSSFVGDDSKAVAQPAAGSCDPSYPEFCVPKGIADLDCPLGRGGAPYAPASNLVVKAPDVHVLDRDGDGIGCESSASLQP